jgi:release factor glutamine methyltransferase
MRLDQAFHQARNLLATRLIENAELDARLLVCHALKLSLEDLICYPEREIDRSQIIALDKLLQRRIAREPVSRIIGTRDFWRSTFVLNSDTLDPRPDSEILIEAALECAQLLKQHKKDGLRVLDLGTGSGCLLISVLMEMEDAYGIGVDIAPRALSAARHNAQLAGVGDRCAFICANWMAPLGARFDLILCNPPYIPSGDMAGLADEVRIHDPRRALDGGKQGLDVYEHLAGLMHHVLNPGGWVILEVGDGLAGLVSDLLSRNKFNLNGGLSAHLHDLSGAVRCVRATGNGVLTPC